MSVSSTILSPSTIFDDCKNDLKEIIGIMENKGY